MANNVMRGIRVCDGYLVCLDLCVDLPGNGARNPSCYLLSMRWFSLAEERVMQQSSISITVGKQITVEQFIKLSIVMRISRHDHVYRHHIRDK